MKLDISVCGDMLAGVGKFLSNFKSYYNEINSATLTGAIDVVVVEQPDGTYQSTPFHVRFGKLGVIRSKEKVVYIEINGEPIDLQMKLGPAGEAFFVQGVQEKWEGPDFLATSPIPSSPLADAVAAADVRASRSDCVLEAQHPQTRRIRHETHSSSSSSSSLGLNGSKHEHRHFKPINQEDDEMIESGGMFEIEFSDDESKLPIPDLHSGMSKAISLPLIQESSLSRTENWAISNYHKSSQLHPFSDTDITPVVSPVGSRPHTPKSDTECEYAERKGDIEAGVPAEVLQQWNWGELPNSSQHLAEDVVTQQKPSKENVQDSESKGLWSFMKNTKKIRHEPEKGGLYLDDINLAEMDPEVAALYFPKSNQDTASAVKEEATDKVDSTHVVHMPDDDVESGQGASLPHSPENVSPSPDPRTVFTPTSESGTMRDNEYGIYGDVSLSLCGGQVADYSDITPELFDKYLITFENLSLKPTESLQHTDLIVRIAGKYYNWSAAAPMIMSMVCFHQTLPESTQEELVKNFPKKQKVGARSSWWPFSRTYKNSGTSDHGEAAGSPISTPSGSPKKSSGLPPPPVLPTDRHSESGSEADDEKEKVPIAPLSVDTNLSDPLSVPSSSDKHYVKTLRLSSEELENLNLKEGQNEIEFSVTTSFQGTTRCSAHIYLWKHTDKIIISDIDGTITKSDVLGQILPMVGKDWSQSGVTDLYTKIAANGYQFAYLSARAIGQATITRDYLKSVKQGKLGLPPGPLFLNPSSLINAFHKEVIERKPEEFKIRCMSDLRSIFTNEFSLYAGFGNRINDIYAYRAVGIPKSRIFLIDPYGKVKTDHSETFQSSYSHLSADADHYFPPLLAKTGESVFHLPAEYSHFTFWREPVPEVVLELPE